MVSLAGHVVERRYLKALTTGPSSDLQAATMQALAYVSVWAMGPTKIVMPGQVAAGANGPFLVAAHELLDQLYAETERLILHKMTAVHYVARALIERDELIGSELDEVFAEAEAADPTLTRPFERKLLQFRTFAPKPQPPQLNAWEPPAGAAAAATPAASRQPGEPVLVPGADLGWGEGPGPSDETWNIETWPEPPDGWLTDPNVVWAPGPMPGSTPEG